MLADVVGLDPLARRLDRLTRGAIGRLIASDAFAKAKAGSGHVLAHPAGIAAEAVQVVKLPRRASVAEARLAGAAVASFNGKVPLTVLAGGHPRAAEVALGLALRAYSFDAYRTPEKDATEPNTSATFMVRDPAAAGRRGGRSPPRPRACSSPAISSASRPTC